MLETKAPQSLQLLCLLRQNINTILIFVFVLVITHMDPNVAMLSGIGFGVYAFIVTIVLLIQLSIWIFKHTPKIGKILREKVSRIIVAFILCLISWQGIDFIHSRIDAKFEPVIQKLENFKEAHGSYPETLKEAVDNPPQCIGLVSSPMYSLIKDSYSIGCMTYGFNHHTYHSNTRRWINYD